MDDRKVIIRRGILFESRYKPIDIRKALLLFFVYPFRIIVTII